MNLTPHFSLQEMTASQTAARQGLDNTPTPEVIEELRRTCAVLEQIRAALNAPVVVTSGYRSPAVNAAVGGVSNSAHKFGRAADIIMPALGSPFEVCQRIAAIDGLPFDQLIYEFKSWAHVAIAAPGETPRKQILTIDNNGVRVGL